MKILFHIDQEERFPILLNNIQNSVGNDEISKIAVVINGPAVKSILKANNYDKELEKFITSCNVEFCACNNALNKFNTENLPIFSNIKIVSGGIIELAHKQQDGYFYIKP